MTSTARFPRLAQRHAVLGYALACAPILVLILNPEFPAASVLALWAVVQGAGVVWIGTGAWDGRERWAARVQVSFLAVGIAALIGPRDDAGVAAAGLVVFVGATMLLHFAHILAQALYAVQGQLTSIRVFARTEAVRQALFLGTFAGPIILGLAPNIVGAASFLLFSAGVYSVTAANAHRRLARGIRREGDDA